MKIRQQQQKKHFCEKLNFQNSLFSAMQTQRLSIGSKEVIISFLLLLNSVSSTFAQFVKTSPLSTPSTTNGTRGLLLIDLIRGIFNYLDFIINAMAAAC